MKEQMKLLHYAITTLLLGLATGGAHSQTNPTLKRMMFVEAFDSGQPNAVILKLYDPGAEVLCYILMPENAARKQVTGGAIVYEGNTVGSISCVPRDQPTSQSNTANTPAIATPPKAQTPTSLPTSNAK